jgi:hypothetical protein
VLRLRDEGQRRACLGLGTLDSYLADERGTFPRRWRPSTEIGIASVRFPGPTPKQLADLPGWAGSLFTSHWQQINQCRPIFQKGNKAGRRVGLGSAPSSVSSKFESMLAE